MASCAAETGLVAMDCLVVCCCCPCLVLQVTVFLLVRLPKKVVVKSKRIILRRWHRRKAAKHKHRGRRGISTVSGTTLAELLEGDFEGALGAGRECSSDGGGRDGWRKRCFAVDAGDSGWKERCFAVDGGDGVWEALVEEEGLFWFGSFWGRTEQGEPASAEDQMYEGLRLPVALERVSD